MSGMATTNANFPSQVCNFALSAPNQQSLPITEKAPAVIKPPVKVQSPATVKAPAPVEAPVSTLAVVPKPSLQTGTFTCKAPEERQTFQQSLFALTKDYRSGDADFTIWSSDVINFMVHSYRLKAASPYFRELMKDPKVTSLIVPTSGFSGTMVVKVLLDIIYTFDPAGCQDIELAFQVITLATEWKCEAVLKILKKDLAIQALINSNNGPSNDHFRLAYKLGDHHLMALMAQRDRDPGPRLYINKPAKPDDTGVSKTYDKAAPGLIGFAGLESPVFELGGLSYGEFLRSPPTVLWALARSTFLARQDHGEVDVNEMAQLFEDLLKLAYPESSPVSQEMVVAAPKAPTTPTGASQARPADKTPPE